MIHLTKDSPFPILFPEGLTMIYFTYDITMEEREIKKPGIAPGAILAGNGYLLNRRLVFSGESGKNPVAAPSYGDRVYGVLYFISDPAEIEALKLLRSPLPRRVTRVRTLPHHRIIFAVTFEAEPDAPLFEGMADREYRDQLVAIARARQFPHEYIDFLELFPTYDTPAATPILRRG
jgi:hypothetical protein